MLIILERIVLVLGIVRVKFSTLMRVQQLVLTEEFLAASVGRKLQVDAEMIILHQVEAEAAVEAVMLWHMWEL
jgi:hypothetical protein